MGRKEDLQNNIKRLNKLLAETEEARDLSSNPKERERLENEIAEYKNTIAEYVLELEKLSEKENLSEKTKQTVSSTESTKKNNTMSDKGKTLSEQYEFLDSMLNLLDEIDTEEKTDEKKKKHKDKKTSIDQNTDATSIRKSVLDCIKKMNKSELIEFVNIYFDPKGSEKNLYNYMETSYTNLKDAKDSSKYYDLIVNVANMIIEACNRGNYEIATIKENLETYAKNIKLNCN